MADQITGERLTSLFRPRSVALVGASALGDDLQSLEVNPLLVDGARIEAPDAIVTWKEHG
jgi:hypothetical protein